MSWLLSSSQSLSPIVQAAIITAVATGTTALVALGGVTLSLRSNRKSEREERYLILKREVYLEAARNYAAATQLLSVPVLGQAETERNQEVSRAFAASVGKILLVGNDRSIKAWLKLQTEFAGIATRLALSSLRLKAAQHTFSEKKAAFDKSVANEQQPNPFNPLMALLNAHKEALSQLKRTITEVEKLLPLSIEATLAAKQELGIHINEAEFTKVSERASKEAKEIIKALVRGFNDWVSSEWESYKSTKEATPDSNQGVARTESKPEKAADRDATQAD